MRRESGIGQQLIELIRGMGRREMEDVQEVSAEIDIVVLARANSGIEDGRGPAARSLPRTVRIRRLSAWARSIRSGEVVVGDQVPLVPRTAAAPPSWTGRR
jgi:hypothetical protein